MSLPFLKLALRKPSLLRAAKIISTTGLATLTTGSTCYFLATRDQTFHHLDETTDPLALHPLTRPVYRCRRSNRNCSRIIDTEGRGWWSGTVAVYLVDGVRDHRP